MTKEELKDFRLSLGMTQAKFASYIGLVREKTVSHYENGLMAIPDWLTKRIEMEKELRRQIEEGKKK